MSIIFIRQGSCLMLQWVAGISGANQTCTRKTIIGKHRNLRAREIAEVFNIIELEDDVRTTKKKKKRKKRDFSMTVIKFWSFDFREQIVNTIVRNNKVIWGRKQTTGTFPYLKGSGKQKTRSPMNWLTPPGP